MAQRKPIRRRHPGRSDHGRELTVDKHTRRLLERIADALEAIADGVGSDTSALESRLGALETATGSLKNAVDKNKPQG